MPERTEHGQQRHASGERPTREAFRDRENPREVYRDVPTGNWIYVGPGGRTHVFTPEGKHHTSFYTTRRGRQKRVWLGRWMSIHPAELR